jgi:hypothetical protein
VAEPHLEVMHKVVHLVKVDVEQETVMLEALDKVALHVFIFIMIKI